VVEREVQELAARIGEEDLTGGAGQLRLKAIACRLRGAYQELAVQNVYPAEVRAAQGALHGRLRDEHGDPYLVARNTGVVPPNPASWEELAQAYEGLIPASEAFAWFNEHERYLRPAERKDLLECIGAAQQRLFRLLDRVFGAWDDQQRELYTGLLECAGALSIRLESLHPATTDAELARLAGRLEKTYRDLRDSIARRLAQETALEALQTLLAEPGFGTREADAERLQAAARACLNAAVPRTRSELRNSLLEWDHFLGDAPDLVALRDEIAKEKKRRAGRVQPATQEDEEHGETQLTPEVEQRRQEIVSLTRGRRCLFLGGHACEERRRRIQEALELEALEWPKTERPDANPNEFEAHMRRNDIVALVTCSMRTGMSNGATQFCRRQGKPVVRLQGEPTVTRVVTDFREQLVSRSATT
jgi:hypothetical protein